MTKEIKLITEALSGLSGTALHAFVWYLIAGKLLPVIIGWAGGITLLCILVHFFRHLAITLGESIGIVKQLRDGLGIGSSGYLNGSEIGKVRAKIPKLLETFKKG